MRIAALSDIHGNLPALEAVLADLAAAAPDLVLNLGDILSGPLWIEETAQRLRVLGWPTIAGNHERQATRLPRERMGASDAFAAERMSEATRDWLLALPATLAPAEGVWCCHGRPDSDVEYLLETVTPQGLRAATPAEVAQRLGKGDAGLVLCGHSHLPRALQLADGRLVVNPGSVGLQAFDDDHGFPHVVENGTPHARYALLTRRPAGWQVELRAVPYAHEAAAARAEENRRGDWADALRSGRVGRTEKEVTG